MCHFTQFCKVTKISIEIIHLFMYNVRIAVLCTKLDKRKAGAFPKGVRNYYVYR